MTTPPHVNVLIVAQAGRLQYEALLFALSLAESGTSRRFRLWVAEPRPGPLWPDDPSIAPEIRARIEAAGGTILPFENRHFGAAYPQGNKIEALFALPGDEPFVFFDSDTLILSPLDDVPVAFDRPTASLRREDTWPKPRPEGPDRSAIWSALYARFGLDFASSLDLGRAPDDWRRYLYFNAGYFHYRCPHVFGRRFLDTALAIRDTPPPELSGQSLDPWLDQVALPLVVHGLGGGREALPAGWIDGRTSCHYRTLPLLYAREPDAVVETLERLAAPRQVRTILADWPQARAMILEGGGRRARALFDRAALPAEERDIRRTLRAAGLWMR